MTTTAPEFVHLHCHSHYSLLDGAGRIGDLLDTVESHGMPALALTDHGNMFGAIEFHDRARKRGIKPILGYEAYMSPTHMGDTDRGQRANGYYHMTLLAETMVGYKNLMALASAAYLKGFYRKPRIDKKMLADHKEGIICLSGCLRSEINYALARDEQALADKALDEYLEMFGPDHFFAEIQYNGIQLQKDVSDALIEMADRRGLPLVLTNDVHYPTPESARVHEVLLCVQTGKTLSDENRFKFQTDEFYIKSQAEMAQVFPHRPEAMAHSLQIAERCDVELEFKGYHLPPFLPPTDETPEAYFRTLCEKGLRERYGDPLSDEIRERFEFEHKVIVEMGFPTYFLITADFIAYARDNGISVGPGRGSAAGSIIAYALRITNVDPLKYDLIFERFLNPGRNELPDIDIDFDAERRGEVIDYVVEKYGREQVCQIITFGKIQAKSGIRDVGRVLGMALGKVDRIAKMVPEVPGIKLAEAMAQEPDLRAAYESDPEITELIDIARGLEGIVRQTGVHAAGVIIADKPVSEYCPLQKVGEDVTTQFPMEQCGDIGLLKMDFLGLKNLTIIEHALDLIAQATGTRPDIDALPLDDAESYALLGRGETRGIFQLESSGMREILVKLQPDRFEDIIALVALYRPGPLGSGMVDRYIDCKHGRAEAEYLHPMLQDVLNETHGVILYQEQVMRIANMMGGFSLSDADRLRKAMGKKKLDLMAKYCAQFVEGAAAHQIPPKVAESIFSLMAEFAKYGFNKSHSAAYALVAYQTAWLKAHYRPEFMAALVSCHSGDTDKVSEYLEECRREGLGVDGPSVNKSNVRFTVVDGRIRYGLGAIKGCGVKALQAIIAAREAEGPFRDLYDLCERVDSRRVTKAVLESLIRAGACDELEGHRAQQIEALEPFLRATGNQGTGRQAAQMGLFDDLDEEEVPTAELPKTPRWQDRELLNEEKKVLGFYFSGHPLTPFADVLERYSSAATTGLAAFGDRATVKLGGLVTRVKTAMVKKGKTAGRKFARMIIEDLKGACSAVCFPDVYESHLDLLTNDKMVFVTAEIDLTGTEAGLIIQKVMPLEEVQSAEATGVLIRLDAARARKALLEELRDLLAGQPGQVPVFFELRTVEGEQVYVSSRRDSGVKPSAELASQLAKLVGFEGFEFRTSVSGNGNGGGAAAPPKREKWRKKAKAGARD